LSKTVIKYISNIEEIKEKLKKAKLPKEFVLSGSETITDVPAFIEANLTIVSVDKLIRFHRPYYTRLKKVLDTLKIEIIIKEK
jgi:hypothetical protein